MDAGRIDIFERRESRVAGEAFRGSGPSDEQSAAMLGASVGTAAPPIAVAVWLVLRARWVPDQTERPIFEPART